jgi:hypothetical protein
MSEASPPTAPEVSPEFFIRVNDFIEMANRIERRFDTHHAQVAMHHAFSRYSAHHYRLTATHDDEKNREAFAEFVGAAVKHLVQSHLTEMLGPTDPVEGSNDAATE